jgi:hypothetical protein
MSAVRKFAQKERRADTEAARVVWPSPAWRGRHLEFARDVLGKRTVAPHQVKILNEYYKPQVVLAVLIFIVVCTGQKLGKTETMIIAAAFDFATETKLNGFVFGPKLEHTNEVFWPRFAIDVLNAYYPCAECMPVHRSWCALVESNPLDETPRPERCPKCSPLIPSKLKNPKDPRDGRISEWIDDKKSENGLRAPDGRAIRGYVSRKEGGKGGFSGCVRFYIDEASDVSEVDKGTIDGNLSGGGKAMAHGNMLYNFGWFYRAFKNEQSFYSFVFQLSSRYSPNCPGRIVWSDGVVTANDNAGRPVPGMATREGIEANLVKWRGTNLVTARIDAKPPEIIEGQIAGTELVRQAEQRWSHNADATGVLQLGVDVARARDKLAIAVRRGSTIVDLFAEALKQDDHKRGVEIVLEYAAKFRKAHERKPRVVYDASGLEGEKFRKELAAQNASEQVDLYPVQMAHKPRNVKLYYHRRDELAYNFANWLKYGALPGDGELEAEIEATTAKAVDFTWNGQTWKVQRVIDNDELRKQLQRSPDKRNACELAVWDVDGTEEHTHAETPSAPSPLAPEAATVVTSSATSKPKPRHRPANDTENDPMPNIYERQAMVYGEMWGAS